MSMNQSNNQIIKKNLLIICRGAGDLATGIIHRLHRAGHRVIALETDYPAAIRRQVSFCEAVYDGSAAVEGVTARIVPALADAETDTETYSGINDTPAAHIASEKWDSSAIEAVLEAGEVPLLIDPKGESIALLKPDVVVDAIIAKKNLGTTREMAPLTIALGPGFAAGQDVDVVVETKRGHKLGRIIREGAAAPNSGVPGIIGGYGAERVLHAQAAGIFRNLHSIADFVEAGEAVAEIETPDGQRLPVVTQISGILRGLLRDGYPVTKGFKVADVDPRRAELENCFLISDKARCIAGSVLELIAAECWN